MYDEIMLRYYFIDSDHESELTTNTEQMLEDNNTQNDQQQQCFFNTGHGYVPEKVQRHREAQSDNEFRHHELSITQLNEDEDMVLIASNILDKDELKMNTDEYEFDEDIALAATNSKEMGELNEL